MVDAGEYDRKRAHRAVRRRAWRRPASTARNGIDVLILGGPAIVTSDFAAVDDIGVARIGDGVAVFFNADGVPLAKCDLSIVAAARDARGATFLLAGADAIRKVVVGIDVIELRGGLVVPGAPRVAAIQRDHRPLIADEQNDVG